MGSSRASLTDRLRKLASVQPDRAALVELTGAADAVVTYRGLLPAVADMADHLRALCEAPGGGTVLCHPVRTGIDSATVLLGALCAGITVFPHPPELTSEALAQTLCQAGLEVRGGIPATTASRAGCEATVAGWIECRYPQPPTFILATSGSTGLPKPAPFWDYARYDPRAVPDVLFRTCRWQDSGEVHLLTLPLYHIAPFSALVQGILDGKTTVLGQDLPPDAVVAAVWRHRVGWWLVTPDDLRALLPAASAQPGALESLRTVLHTAAACEPELKWAWLDLLGAERVTEMYGATEGVGATVIHGPDWLARPGSVGRGVLTRIKVLNSEGGEVAPGEMGHVHLKRLGGGPATERRAGSLHATADGYVTLGDLGWLDADGFLYIADRAVNRVEAPDGPVWLSRTAAALRDHPSVVEAVCVDGGEGRGIVAVVVPHDEVAFDVEGLINHCTTRLAPHECPRNVVTATAIPRTGLGKPDLPALVRLARRELSDAVGDAK